MEMNDGIEKGVVKSIENGVATVVVGRTGACDSCMISGMCMGKNKTIEHQIRTNIPLKPGDCVRIEIAPASRIASSFIVFIVPIIMMVVFYSVGRFLIHLEEVFSILVSIGGLLLSGIIIYMFDKLMSGKINVEIMEKLEEA